MAGLVPAIHVFGSDGVDARHIGERSDAVLRTAMAGHDGSGVMLHGVIGSALATAISAG
jgi:hypothetical protein